MVTRGRRHRRPAGLQLPVEEGQELAARVVEDDDRALAQQVVQLLAEVVVEGVHAKFQGSSRNYSPKASRNRRTRSGL